MVYQTVLFVNWGLFCCVCFLFFVVVVFFGGVVCCLFVCLFLKKSRKGHAVVKNYDRIGKCNSTIIIFLAAVPHTPLTSDNNV